MLVLVLVVVDVVVAPVSVAVVRPDFTLETSFIVIFKLLSLINTTCSLSGLTSNLSGFMIISNVEPTYAEGLKRFKVTSPFL